MLSKYSSKKKNLLLKYRPEKKEEKLFILFQTRRGFDMRYAGKLFGVFKGFTPTRSLTEQGWASQSIQRIIHRHKGEVLGKK